MSLKIKPIWRYGVAEPSISVMIEVPIEEKYLIFQVWVATAELDEGDAEDESDKEQQDQCKEDGTAGHQHALHEDHQLGHQLH